VCLDCAEAVCLVRAIGRGALRGGWVFVCTEPNKHDCKNKGYVMSRACASSILCAHHTSPR
jgi:hypothetical protein